jgi:hypothetical protein
VALVTADAHNGVLQQLEHQPAELIAALRQCGVAAEAVAWKDPAAAWDTFHYALLTTVRTDHTPSHQPASAHQQSGTRCVQGSGAHQWSTDRQSVGNTRRRHFAAQNCASSSRRRLGFGSGVRGHWQIPSTAPHRSQDPILRGVLLCGAFN